MFALIENLECHYGMEIRRYESKNFSKFKTLNTIEQFCEIKNPQDAIDAFSYAKKNNLPTFVLGAGSNVFFKNIVVKTFVLSNSLPHSIEALDENLVKVSSSTPLITLLRWTYARNLDAPYYLSSAPCQVGGAIAMNAGTGTKENLSIFDFLEEIEFVKDAEIVKKKKSEIKFAYRHTEFLDASDVFILSATFKFETKNFDANPIKVRLDWANENQDLKSNNCGSLCYKYNAKIMKFCRWLFKRLPAGISPKKLNWAVNKSYHPFWLRLFLNTLVFMHKILRKEIKLEVKIVE